MANPPSFVDKTGFSLPSTTQFMGGDELNQLFQLIRGDHLTEAIQQAAIDGLVTALAAKAALSHTHPQSDITNLISDLAAKATLSHTHLKADITDFTSRSFIQFSLTAIGGNGRFMPMYGDAINLASEIQTQTKFQSAMTAKSLQIYVAQVGDTPNEGIVLRDDGVDTAISIQGVTTTGQKETSIMSVPIAAGSLLSYQITKGSQTNFFQIHGVLEVDTP